ncbi:PREDICTED: uncharacterized protein LOC109222727, partial [Nicotiana attenuata]|uniref:uncharacterized protein LOC109222727 n=1 Tax=Nicotiana attenuata TaxID=49451 RepID=UPI0009053BDC
DLIFTGNNPKMFEEFKKAMAREFEMTDIGLMAYYLGIQVAQRKGVIFISQGEYAKEILKNVEMENCNPAGYPFWGWTLESLYGNSYYLALKGSEKNTSVRTLDYEILYSSSKESKFLGYCDSDWAGDIDDRKSTTGFVFFLGNSAFTWNSKKQPIVTLSTCEAEYVAACSCVAMQFG